MYKIFETIAGSYLYGTNTTDSDKDIRGVFIPTKEYFLGFAKNIEQQEESGDVVYYEIRKFFKLCCECNPNIVELLFAPHPTIAKCEWNLIIKNRNLFLSRKARYTFAGYAVSQLKRIEGHRRWLLHPPKKQPSRSDFGLPEDKVLVSKDELNAFTELINNFNLGNTENLENWHFDKNTLYILQQEKAFQNALKDWNNYLSWQKNRNPIRAELEKKCGYDSKHAAHCVRLISQGKELLLTGCITLPRPDVNFLLEIKNGKFNYNELMVIIGELDTRFDDWYSRSVLPNKPDIKAADNLCVDIAEKYLKKE